MDVAGLEQRCIDPGQWLIEGVTVTRHRQYGLSTWWVIHEQPGIHSQQVPTLAEARRRIVDAINAGRL